MIGITVEFPAASGCYRTGIVTEFNEITGRVTVKDDEGVVWYGYEYQILPINIEVQYAT